MAELANFMYLVIADLRTQGTWDPTTPEGLEYELETSNCFNRYRGAELWTKNTWGWLDETNKGPAVP